MQKSRFFAREEVRGTLAKSSEISGLQRILGAAGQI